MKTIQKSIWSVLVVVLWVSGEASAISEKPYEVAWIRQLGTNGDDKSGGASADGTGNVYISGITSGSLGGPNAGGWDAFVSKYDTSGNLLWTRQLGTNRDDLSFGVSADNLGSVFISGVTQGSLGGTNAGGLDAFVSKYDALGNLLWTHQIGTRQWDESFGVSTDGLGNVFISGKTEGSLGGLNAGGYDAFVSKYDAVGNLLWTRQIGTKWDDESYGVSADGLGNVFISGMTRGSLGGPYAGDVDAFVSNFDTLGNLLWTRQLGTSDWDTSDGVSADGMGNVYISGWTDGSLGGPNAGKSDAFVSKYDEAGNLLWTRQLGTDSSEETFGISADCMSNVFISGVTWGPLGGPNAGDADVFVGKFDRMGNLLWTHQIGTNDTDYGNGVSVDILGNVYISGWTLGPLGGPNAGGADAFVVKLVPEPATISLLGLGFAGIAGMRRRRQARPLL